jgi:hypothetical protein
MPEALSSFLVSVSIILAMALFIPCIESIAKLLRRNADSQKQAAMSKGESGKGYSREVA